MGGHTEEETRTSHQMKPGSYRQRLRTIPLKHLRELLAAVQSRIEELERLPARREIDIAADHTGDKELIHAVLWTVGDQTTGRWRQSETIYCCPERCPSCPHGEFLFRYRRNKRKGTLTVTFVGFPALDDEVLEQMHSEVRAPHAYKVPLGRLSDA